MRHVVTTMGTVLSLESEATDAVLTAVDDVFRRADERYSLYRPDSELSRIRDGALSLLDASEQLREIYAAALSWRTATDGAFSVHRPDGVLDLNGIVKAWAMAEAGALLGEGDWALDVGGDILVSGPVLAGIVDPDDRSRMLTAVTLDGARRAMATSGSAERGDHIWKAGAGDIEFVQVSVLAADIITADVLATAIVAGGTAFLDRATDVWDIDVLTVDRQGALLMTPGLRRRIPA